MKQQLRTLFSPILNTFESGNEPFEYRASHRTILLVIGVLFSGLATLLFWLVLGKDPAYLFPVFVFGAVGFVAFLVGGLGTDRAVAKIWNSRK